MPGWKESTGWKEWSGPLFPYVPKSRPTLLQRILGWFR